MPAATGRARRRRRFRGSIFSRGASGLSEGRGHHVGRGAVAGKNGGNRAAAHDGNAVAHAEDFRQVTRYHQHGEAVPGEAADDFMDFTFRAHVHALGRFVQDEDPGGGGEPAGEGDLLLVAAAQGMARGFGAVGADVQLADELEGARAFRAEPEPGAGENFPVDGHGDVLRQGHFEDDAMAPAVFGHVSDAAGDSFPRGMDLDFLAVQKHFTGIGGSDAEKGPGQFGAAGADQPGQAQNFPGADIQSDIFTPPAAQLNCLSERATSPGAPSGGG